MSCDKLQAINFSALEDRCGIVSCAIGCVKHVIFFYTKCGRYLSDSFVRTRKHLDIFNGLGSSGGYFGVIDFSPYFTDTLP